MTAASIHSVLRTGAWTLLTACILFFSPTLFAQETAQQSEESCHQSRQFTFSWSMLDSCSMAPRGGTSKGVDTKLDPEVHKGWLSLQEDGLSSFEKDRRAILAMSGAYRVSFDFLETVGYTPDFKPTQPYQSWGTEYVYVAKDTGDYISLQHVMVMYFKEEDGGQSAPMVMKHWRQDWHYEKTEQLVYAGHGYWQKHTLTAQESKGTWSQSVYQVDDSPRYESHGKWEHTPSYSSWKSDITWRPLPRRESSVRSDYHVLEGTNRHTILPSGWVQEEENLKLVLTEDAQPHPKTPYLAKELGVARYERIVGHDFQPGHEYWEKSSPFWADVRNVWHELINTHSRIKITKKVDNQFMFMPFFSKAQQVADGETYSSEKGQQAIREMLQPFVETE